MSTIRELAEEHWQGRGELVHTHHPVQPVHVHHDDGTHSTASEEIDEGLLTLSTIHSAKGLEWRAVFVIGLVDGRCDGAPDPRGGGGHDRH